MRILSHIEEDEREDILIIQRDFCDGKGYVQIVEGPFNETYRKYFRLLDKFKAGIIKKGGILLIDSEGNTRTAYTSKHTEVRPRSNSSRRSRWGRR